MGPRVGLRAGEGRQMPEGCFCLHRFLALWGMRCGAAAPGKGVLLGAVSAGLSLNPGLSLQLPGPGLCESLALGTLPGLSPRLAGLYGSSGCDAGSCMDRAMDVCPQFSKQTPFLWGAANWEKSPSCSCCPVTSQIKTRE